VASTDKLTVKAPFAGVVVSVAHAAAERVDAGAPLLVLEAMKMEHEILAPRDGIVAAVLVKPGEQVATRRLLVELEPLAAE
jgi:3-methylcrotonyl-CoA carboxylase alpha subunit